MDVNSNEGLSTLGMRIPLTDKERVGITVLNEQGVSRPAEKQVFTMVGKLLTSQPYDFKCFLSYRKIIFGVREGLEVINLEGDRMLFHAFNESDKQRMMDKRPWFVDGSLLLLNDVPENMNPLQVDLSWSSFYIRIHDLPLCYQTKDMAVLIANKIGIFEEYDEKETSGFSLRVRVKVNVDEPLTRFLKVKSLSGYEVVARFTYEGLKTYCYLCGHLDHSRRDCELKNKINAKQSIDELPYGTWLREKRKRVEIFRDLEINGPCKIVGRRKDTLSLKTKVGGSYESRKKINKGKIKIFVDCVTGKKLKFEVERSETVENLIWKIEDKEGTLAELQILIYDGRKLHEGSTLAECNIEDESTIDLILNF